MFGGYDLEKFAKKGSTENDIVWAHKSVNPAYWSVFTSGFKFGSASLADNKQQAILDNGMSFAMAPHKPFLKFISSLYHDHGILCQPNKPMWSCTNAFPENYKKLPPIEIEMILNKEGKTTQVKMPREAYMKMEPGYGQLAWLLISPWQFNGIGGKPGEEYWVLGAQFL